ncbi:MAG: hypothetical protein M5U28_03210 [Sandaracinaceae bacterium]|nr:hypothetical protein [Sandaracinaceae bacterium]
MVAARSDGRIQIVLDQPRVTDTGNYCAAVLTHAARGYAGLNVAINMSGELGASIVMAIDAATQDATLLATLDRTLLGPNFVSDLYPGDRFIAAQVVLSQQVWRIGLDGAAVRIDDPSAAGAAYVSDSGEVILYEQQRSTGLQSLWVAEAGEAPGRPLIEQGDAEPDEPRTNGRTLVWSQKYGFAPGGYERIELWSSPFATRSEDLEPRLVGVLPVRHMSNNFTLGEDHVGVPDDGRILVVSTVDGEVLSALYPGGDGVEWRGTTIVFMGAAEMAVSPSLRARSPQDYETVRIYRYDAMPPPPSDLAAP